TCLYYLSLLFMVELDAKRFGAHAVPFDQSMTLWQMTRRYGFHFTSLIAVIVYMILGYSPMLSVFYSTLMCFVLSGRTEEPALAPRPVLIGVLIVAAAAWLVGLVPLPATAQASLFFFSWFPYLMFVLIAALAVIGLTPAGEAALPTSKKL